jgi:hypothetical protein
LKEAGIGGVEINPVEFPSRSEGDDLGKPSVKWLSNEWIDLLKIVFDEARSLGMVCDLIVGSGWPFGNVTDFNYGVVLSSEIENSVRRMRYDFDMTKTEILRENFTKTYIGWCKKLNVKSRAQAYRRGLFPLESSFDYDIPEGESWTMNWLNHFCLFLIMRAKVLNGSLFLNQGPLQ